MKVKVKVYAIADLMENEVLDIVGSYEEAVEWVLDNRDQVYEYKGDAEVSIEGFEVEASIAKMKRYEEYLQESLEHWESLGDKPIRAESVAAGISDFLDDEKSR